MTGSAILTPDLEMRVRTLPEHGGTRLSYTLHSPAGKASFYFTEIAGPFLRTTPEEFFFAKIRRQLEGLSERRDVDGAPLLKSEIERKLSALGRQLWHDLFPRELKAAYREIRDSVRTWLIVSDESWIPWELVKPFDDSLPNEPIDDEFLSLRFELSRWLFGAQAPSGEIMVDRLAAIAAAAGGLAQAGDELRLLSGLASRSGVVSTTQEPASAEELLGFLETARAEVLHFLGDGSLTKVYLPDGSSLRPNDLEGPVAAHLRRHRPFVFMNACWAGTEPWANRWVIACGCGAFVAPSLPVRDRAALAFARVFYEALYSGATLGEAARGAREYLNTVESEGIASLAYTIYGHPNARVLFGEEANLRNASTAIREKILSFAQLIERKTEGFVGRQWLFDAIDRFVQRASCGYIQILGDPGIGKTALIAEMVRRFRHPHHFNIRSEGIQAPEQFLTSICAQLVAKFDLGYVELPPEVSRDSSFLAGLLEKATAKLLPSGRKLLILVDALDESDPTAVSQGSNPLYLPSDLPDGVFFVVTSRRGGPLLRYSCPEHKIDLQRETESNFADIRLLVDSWLGHEGVQTYIHNQGLDDTAFADKIVALSEGNFMYLAYVLPAIETGFYRDRSFALLPTGLQSFYEDHWVQMRGEDSSAWRDYKLRILVTLTIAKEPISMDLIAEFSGIEKKSQISTVLDEWAAFLQSVDGEEGGAKETRWRLYHDSFRDFIAAKDQVQAEQVDLRAAHGTAAEELWRVLYPEDLSSETLNPFPAFQVQKIEIRNFKNIERLELEMTPPSSLPGHWTCIAGINGSGKTAILQALTLALLGPQLARELGGPTLLRMLRRVGEESRDTEIRAHVRLGEGTATFSLDLERQRIGSELPLRGAGPFDRMARQVIVAYGASRNLSSDREDRYDRLTPRARRQMTLFDPRARITDVDLLLGDAGNHPALGTLRRLVESILGDELKPTSGTAMDRLVFRQTDAAVEAIDLPDGFRSTVTWLADRCAPWHAVTGIAEPSNPADLRGLVLIDEIDLHLHPSLQRALVPRLREALPNVQFIVTTHSPLVLSSFDRHEIVALDRSAEGGVRELDRQIFGFSADEVYEWLMETRPQSTVLEQKLQSRDDPDLALYFHQSVERSEDEARVDLAERRRLIEKFLGPQTK